MTRAFCVAALLAAAAPLSAQRGPAASTSHVPADVLALACAPAITTDTPAMPLHITGGQEATVRRNYAPGDLVTINAGTRNGITLGQEFFIRRVQVADRARVTPARPAVVRTAGWLRVYAVDEAMSLATIEHACDAIESGDYLEPFVLPEVPAAADRKPKAERDNYAHVLVGIDLRRSFGKGDFFTIDRGSSQGVAPGAQFVVYRDKHQAQNFLFELGEAVAVDVRQNTATLQVTMSRDAFTEGDYVAQRK